MKKNCLYGAILLIFILILAICLYLFVKPKYNLVNKKTFTFWSIQLKPIYENEINSIIKEFELKHPNYKVVWVDIPIGEAQKRTLASILSSNPPDLVNLNPEFSLVLAQKNALHIFKEDDVKTYNQNIVNKLKYKNNIYALPFYWTSSTTIYNKEVYNDCIGDSFISRYDELDLIYEKFKACEKRPSNMILFAANLNENDTLSKILNKYDIEKLQSKAEKSRAAEIFSIFNNLYKENMIEKDTLTINHREVIEKYMSEGAMTIVLGSNFIKMIKENAPDVYKKSALAPQLKGENGKFDIALMNLIVPKKSKNIDLALEFAHILTSYENQLKLAKITNVLPVNKEAIEDDYFKSCSDDLYDESRCLSAKQLDNLIDNIDVDNKKSYNEYINKAFEEVLLNPKTDYIYLQNVIDKLAKELKPL